MQQRAPLAGRALPAAAGAASASSTRAADAPYEELRGEYDFPKLEAFFKRRPWEARARRAARAAQLRAARG